MFSVNKEFYQDHSRNKTAYMSKPCHTSTTCSSFTDKSINKLNNYPETNNKYCWKLQNLNEKAQKYQGVDPGLWE